MALRKEKVIVYMADLDPIKVTIHVRGLAMWRFRLFMARTLMWWINIIAPRNVSFDICKECSLEGTTDAAPYKDDPVSPEETTNQTGYTQAETWQREIEGYDTPER